MVRIENSAWISSNSFEFSFQFSEISDVKQIYENPSEKNKNIKKEIIWNKPSIKSENLNRSEKFSRISSFFGPHIKLSE